MSRDITVRPRQDSNLRFRLRRPALYPLSYGGDRRDAWPFGAAGGLRHRGANTSAGVEDPPRPLRGRLWTTYPRCTMWIGML